MASIRGARHPFRGPQPEDRDRSILDGTHAFADPSEADAGAIRLILRTPESLPGIPRPNPLTLLQPCC
jgi:hypothetical protein